MTLFKKKRQEPEDPVAADELPEVAAEEMEETGGVEGIQKDPIPAEDKESAVQSDDSDGSGASDDSDTSDQPDSLGFDPSDPLVPLLKTLRSEFEAGVIGDETRKLLSRALNYDRDMIQAKAEGELAGRNAAIEEHLLTRDDSDGVPHPGCGQGASTSAHRFSIFDLARDAMM